MIRLVISHSVDIFGQKDYSGRISKKTSYQFTQHCHKTRFLLLKKKKNIAFLCPTKTSLYVPSLISNDNRSGMSLVL